MFIWEIYEPLLEKAKRLFNHIHVKSAFFRYRLASGFDIIPVYIYNLIIFIYLTMSSLTRGNTYARQPGSVDVNVQFDYDEMARRNHQAFRSNPRAPLFRTGRDAQNQNVLEGEVLVTDQKKSGRMRDKRLHVFSSANGLLSRNGTDANTFIHDYAFAGVAVTPVDVATHNRDQGFVAAFAGLNKIFNTGLDDIHAGDIVYLDTPGWDVTRNGAAGATHAVTRTSASNKGVPRDKIRFGVTAIKQGTDNQAKKAVQAVRDVNLNDLDNAKFSSDAAGSVVKHLIQLLNDVDALSEANKEKIKTAAKGIIKDTLDYHHSVQRRVIGKALSHAKRGQAFDIILRGG